MRIGFVGLGQMGRPIARNLRKSGAEIVAFDRDPARMDGLEAEGLVPAAALSEIAEADLVALCLPDGAAVAATLFGPDGLVERLAPGRIVVDLSTIPYGEAVALAERLAAKGLHFLDAPVSGMPARAVDGTLTIMCGGAPEVFAEVESLLRHVGTTVLHMGPSGSGQLTKTVNNVIYDINIAALAEVLPMAVRMGLDPDLIGQVVTTGTARSLAAEFFVPRMLAGRFDEGYPLASAYKDLVSVAGAAMREGLPMPLTAAATATYQTALRRGHGGKDKGAMILPVEDLLGVSVRSKRSDRAGES